jgi:hypothetical protein
MSIKQGLLQPIILRLTVKSNNSAEQSLPSYEVLLEMINPVGPHLALS